MPASLIFWIDGRMASESKATTRMTSTFWVIRPSMSAACFCAEPCASVEMYLSPAASTTALIAASSVFQRSSWKVFQDTAIVLPSAIAEKRRQW